MDSKKYKLDTQQVEIIGRNYLCELVLREKLEVALPIRDHGVDLIIYDDSSTTIRMAPVQLKVFSNEGFNLDVKFSRFPNLIMAYVWNVGDSGNTSLYLMTYAEAEGIANELSPYFGTHGKYARNNSSVAKYIQQYKYSPGAIRARLGLHPS